MENPFSQEQPKSKDEVIAALKENGLDGPTLEVVRKWTEQREKEIRAIEDRIDLARASIRLNIDRADFYATIGDTVGVRESYEDALTQALSENQNDLVAEIEEKLNSLGGR